MLNPDSERLSPDEARAASMVVPVGRVGGMATGASPFKSEFDVVVGTRALTRAQVLSWTCPRFGVLRPRSRST